MRGSKFIQYLRDKHDKKLAAKFNPKPPWMLANILISILAVTFVIEVIYLLGLLLRS